MKRTRGGVIDGKRDQGDQGDTCKHIFKCPVEGRCDFFGCVLTDVGIVDEGCGVCQDKARLED